VLRVYIFTFHSSDPGDFREIYTGLAITEKGKWVAGSCSQREESALEYLERMKARIAERVGRPVEEVELVRERRTDLIAKAFETMP
jgi:hypothetical protein